MNTYECNYNLPYKIRYQLLSHVFELNFHHYVSKKGTETELQATHCNDPYLRAWFTDLINPNFKINAMIFIKFMPNRKIDEHVDDSLDRASCITWALAPHIRNFAPVIYDEPIYYTDKPLILNTTVPHQMQNNEYERISFQLCFSNDIEEFVEYDKKGILFR